MRVQQRRTRHLLQKLAHQQSRNMGSLQVTARTISMQFEGNWAAVADVIVDKVGKYAHVIGSPLDTASTPVVMDVSLDVRTKVRGASWLRRC